LKRAAAIPAERAALWRAHGGTMMAFPHGHLSVEGECDLIAERISALAAHDPGVDA